MIKKKYKKNQKN